MFANRISSIVLRLGVLAVAGALMTGCVVVRPHGYYGGYRYYHDSDGGRDGYRDPRYDRDDRGYRGGR